MFAVTNSGEVSALIWLFWLSVAIVFYTYAGYPLLLWIFSTWFGRDESAPAVSDEDLPFASLLIAAHNEAAVIGARVDNLLAIDYPADRFEVVVASDGSTDGTADIVRSFAHPNVRVLEYAVRRGKASVLNDAIAALKGDVILLSDANTFTDANAPRRLARWFSDPSIGVVCGRLILTDPETGQNVDSVYWRWETKLKRLESRLGALLGANGAIYALRWSLFAGIRADTAVDDFVVPLLTRLRTGCRLVFDPDALAFEQTPMAISDEFRRRSRIGAGGFQSLTVLAPLLDPRRGWIALTFWSHKVLRWICPFSLLGALVSSLLLAGYAPIFALAAFLQAVLYTLAGAGYFVSGSGAAARVVRMTSMFASMNAALFVGFWLWVSGRQQGVWQRTAR